MKRLVLLFTILSSFLVFYMGFQVYSERQYEQLVNLEVAMAEEVDQEVLGIELDLSQKPEYVLKNLTSFLNQHNYTAVSHYVEKENDLKKTQFLFLYTKDSLSDFPFLKTKQKRRIDFSETTDKYYSSQKSDKDKSDTLEFLNPVYYKSYQQVFQIRQLSTYHDIAKHNTFIPVYIVCDNKKDAYSEIQSSKLNDFLTSEVDVGEQEETKFFSPIDVSTSIILLSLVSVSLLLMIFCEILSHKKEIAIRKLQGMSNLYIFKTLYLKTVVKLAFVYILVTCFSYYIILSTYEDIQYTFLVYVAKMFFIFMILLLIVSCCSYLIIRFLRSHMDLKRNSHFTWAIKASTFIKIGAITLMLPSLYLGSVNGIQAIQKSMQLHQNQDLLSNNLYVEGITDGEIPLEKIEPLLHSYMQEHGAIYQDFNQNLNNELLHKAYPTQVAKFEHPFIIVNQNYLANDEIKTMEGDVVSLEKVADHTVLVPERYKDVDVRKYAPLCQSIVYVENGKSYLNRYPLLLDTQERFVKDPIIEIRTKLDEDLSWNGEYMMLPYTQKNLDGLRAYFKKAGLEHQVELDTSQELYSQVVDKNKDECITLMITLLIYIMLMVAFMYQNIFLYFSENKQLIALNYLSGKNFYQRYVTLLSQDLVVYCICFVIGYWLLKLSFPFMLIFTLASIAVQLLLMKLMVHKFERRNMVGVLKGE